MATSGDTSSSPEEHPLDAGEPAYQSNPTFQKRGKARLAAKLVAVLLVIGLIIPLLLGLPTLQHGKKARDDNQPDRLPAAPWKTYLDVKESTVIKDRSLTVGGDILIRRGAELDLVNCSVVMNGTFYAEGRLSLTRTTIRDFEPDYGYSWHFYDWPAITTNLTGCRQARFDFNYTGQLYAPVWIDVVRDGTRTQRIWNTSYMGDEVESASVDLSPFCGGIVELDFCSTATL